ncbi:MAG: hypothetical protein ACLQVN_26125 [Bryobacteraceae bacterium]
MAGALLLVAAVTSFTAWHATRSTSGSGDLPLIRLDADQQLVYSGGAV